MKIGWFLWLAGNLVDSGRCSAVGKFVSFMRNSSYPFWWRYYFFHFLYGDTRKLCLFHDYHSRAGQEKTEKVGQRIVYEEDSSLKKNLHIKTIFIQKKPAKIYLYMKIQWFRLNQENVKAVESTLHNKQLSTADIFNKTNS